MKLYNSWLSRAFFVKAILLYAVLYVCIGFSRPMYLPSNEILFVQTTYILALLVVSFEYSWHSIRKTITVIFLFYLLCSFALRLFNLEYFGKDLGYDTIDGETYHRFASWLCSNSFGHFIVKMQSYGNYKLDDFGQFGLVYWIYRIFTPEIGIQVMILVNAVAVALSSMFLYKTSRLFFARSASNFVAFLWGCEAFAIYTCAGGLKENIMLLFVNIAVYFLCKLHTRKFTAYNVIMFFAAAGMLLLYRLALFYILLLAFVTAILLKRSFVKNHIRFFIGVVGIVTVVVAPAVISMISVQRGYSSDFLMEDSSSRMQEAGGSLGIVTNIFAAIFGPFPSFVADSYKANYITLYSFTPFVKVLYSFYLLYAIIRIVKKQMVAYFPILVYFLLSSFMLVFTFYSLHDRYQWVHIPATMILAAKGFKEWHSNQHFLPYNKYYLVVAILFVVVYNMRSL